MQIQDIRNGTVRDKYKREIKYKDGIPYKVIERAYELAQKDIEYAILSMNLRVEAEINYCLAIARDRINDIMRLDKKKAETQRIIEAKETHMLDFEPQETTGYKKSNTDDDLSFLLGDD